MDNRNIMEIEEETKQRFVECSGDIIPSSMVSWLSEIGYFMAPGAKVHHSARVGGLFDHSEQVAKALAELTNGMHLQWQRQESPVIIGLLHDVCKTEEYSIILEPQEKNGYRIEWNKNQIITGHGIASVMMIQQYAIKTGEFVLTEEEMMCIRFHMGAFTEKSEWEFYSRAIKKYPNVLYTHTADMIASKIKGV